jgi:DNA polymerase V
MMYDPEIPYKKAGVIIGGIIPEEFVSASLFEDTQMSLSKTSTDDAIDALNSRFGKGTVKIGSMLGSHMWIEKKKLMSKEYTTKWSEIAIVKAV